MNYSLRILSVPRNILDGGGNNKSSVGHFMVEITNPSGGKKAYGFYPGGFFGKFGIGRGIIKDDTATAKDNFLVEGSRPIILNRERGQIVIENIEKWKKSPQRWTPFYNCIDFAQDQLDAAGIKIELWQTLSPKQRQQIGFAIDQAIKDRAPIEVLLYPHPKRRAIVSNALIKDTKDWNENEVFLIMDDPRYKGEQAEHIYNRIWAWHEWKYDRKDIPPYLAHGDGPVYVREHVRDGVKIRAHTRSAPE